MTPEQLIAECQRFGCRLHIHGLDLLVDQHSRLPFLVQYHLWRRRDEVQQRLTATPAVDEDETIALPPIPEHTT